MVESTDSLSRPAEFEAAIKRRIAQQTGERIRTLEVEMVGTRVVIRGQVTSFHLKQLAIHGVVDVLGSSSTIWIDIDGQITVRPPGPEPELN